MRRVLLVVILYKLCTYRLNLTARSTLDSKPKLSSVQVLLKLDLGSPMVSYWDTDSEPHRRLGLAAQVSARRAVLSALRLSASHLAAPRRGYSRRGAPTPGTPPLNLYPENGEDSQPAGNTVHTI